MNVSLNAAFCIFLNTKLKPTTFAFICVPLVLNERKLGGTTPFKLLKSEPAKRSTESPSPVRNKIVSVESADEFNKVAARYVVGLGYPNKLVPPTTLANPNP